MSEFKVSAGVVPPEAMRNHVSQAFLPASGVRAILGFPWLAGASSLPLLSHGIFPLCVCLHISSHQDTSCWIGAHSNNIILTNCICTTD